MRDKTLSRWAWMVPVLVLGAGFLDLVRGGITVSAILLSTGFLVAIPWAIVAGSTATDSAPSYREAIVAGAAVLGLYLLTLSPSTAMWDAFLRLSKWVIIVCIVILVIMAMFLT